MNEDEDPQLLEASRVRAVGAFWKRICGEESTILKELAEEMGETQDLMTQFGNGEYPLEDLPEDFFIRLAQALDRDDALDEHIRKYDTDYAAMDELAEEGEEEGGQEQG